MKTLRTTASSLAMTSQFDEETRAFLQSRLRLMSGVLGALLWVLIGLFLISTVAAGRGGPIASIVGFATVFPNSILFWMAVVVTAVYVVVRLDQRTAGQLALLDAVLILVLIAPCLALYGLLHNFSFSGFAFVVPFLILFLLARAILVPSTPLRTLVLCLPAPVGVLLIQLSYGASFFDSGQAYRAGHYTDTLIQNQVCLLGAVALAVVATRVNLSLRRRSFDARRVGQYDMGAQIGSGAMGEVYQATHALLKRETALKFLRPDITGAETLRRFEQEVRLASRLTHPNNIAIYDYGYTADGLFYYAMELLEGATLKEMVLGGGPLPAGRIIELLVQACAALGEAHDKGILHRDIKAANIMVCERGGEYDRVKILDFGLAQSLHAVSRTPDGRREVSGTPETMAPEVWRGEELGPASDLYSLAVVAHQLATGVAPFKSDSIDQLGRLHVRWDPDPPSKLNPDVPADLEAVILKGLRKDPQRRHADALAFRGALLGCRAAGSWTQSEAKRWWNEFQPESARAAASRISESTISSMETMIEPDLERSL